MATDDATLDIAVVGSGISGLAAAWLLGTRHRVTLYEQADRVGGHSNTISVPLAGGDVPVDTGFIVFNEPAYPNLTALFARLGVATDATDMTFSVSLDSGRLEYAGGTIAGLLAQPSNLAKPRFWMMVRDIVRFYREAPALIAAGGAADTTLGQMLDAGRFSRAFREDHILPMAGAIWSAPAEAMLDYPAAAFVRFFENHGLLKLTDRPLWRTVAGGSQRYVRQMLADFSGAVRLGTPVKRLDRTRDGVNVHVDGEAARSFDHVVVATHADQALRMLGDADGTERRLLGAFRYVRNRAVLHSDPALMPRRRAAWASWNYLSTQRDSEPQAELSVSYWMNRLQRLDTEQALIVTLNPAVEPDLRLVHREDLYDHPLFDVAANQAQSELWSLQGRRRTWFCGAHFGAGFHEDGLQAGLAVAEQLGRVRRPWRVENQSGRLPAASTPDFASFERAA